MITKTGGQIGEKRVAIFSDCMTFRYVLTIYFTPDEERIEPHEILTFLMLNPSTADEMVNDPTVARCQKRAARLGFKAVRILNLFAIRATDPRDMKKADNPIGVHNNGYLRAYTQCVPVVCAWGADGDYLNRHKAVVSILENSGAKIFHLGLTKAGHPRHPLYLKDATPLTEWEQRYAA